MRRMFLPTQNGAQYAIAPTLQKRIPSDISKYDGMTPPYLKTQRQQLVSERKNTS